MSTLNLRRSAATCLMLAPFIYSLGVNLYHHDQFRDIGKCLIFLWILVSLVIGIAAALTYRLQIFGFNCGSFLCYSVAIIILAWTLQTKEVAMGAWIMYGYFVISFCYGCLILTLTLKKTASKSTPK